MKTQIWIAVTCIAGLTTFALPAHAEPSKDGKSLTEWRKILKTAASADDRLKAAVTIGDIGEEDEAARAAVDDLLAALADKDFAVRAKAAEAIAKIGVKLERKGPEVKKAATFLLAALKANKSPDYKEVRLELFRALCNASPRDPATAREIVPAMLSFFNDKDEYTRRCAIGDLCTYLEESGLKDQIKVVSAEVAKALRDSNEGVRDAAKDGLPKIDPEAAKKLGIE